jgi:hypothetical protein
VPTPINEVDNPEVYGTIVFVNVTSLKAQLFKLAERVNAL